MSNQEQPYSFVERTIASPAWFDALIAETTVVEQTGVHASMVSIRLQYSPDTDMSRLVSQARTLFGLVLRPTDRIEQTASNSFVVLLAPQKDLAETVSLTAQLDAALLRSGILASTGFAQRRPLESLIDTWARAEAQLDRAVYRLEHRNGLRLT